MRLFKIFIKTLLGFCLFYFFPRKKVVVLVSSMRSGSTLLKALLSEAEEIEHVNEQSFYAPLNNFAHYFDFWYRSNSKIILAKKPSFFTDYRTYPILPKTPHKVIFLFRNPLQILDSLSKNEAAMRILPYKAEYHQYIETTMKNMYSTYQEYNIYSTVVFYEQLVSSPKEATKKLFDFLELNYEGVDSYSSPKTGWKWGVDDGGELISGRKVVNQYKERAPKTQKEKELLEEFNRIKNALSSITH